MKTTGSRALVLILGILLVIMGIVLFATPGANSVALSYVFCILMLVFGIAEIFFYLSHRKAHIVSGWVLADGIITTILSILLLCMPGFQTLTMSYIFSFWVLFTGVTRTSAAFAAKDAGSRNWGWILATGIIGILLGTWLLFYPILAVMTIGYLIPFAFLMQGISAIATFFATSSNQ